MGKEWDNFNQKEISQTPSPFMQDMQARRNNNEGWSPSYFTGRGQTIKESTKARDAFIAFMTAIMTEALRVLKPGGHALVWALPRTSHWTACALEDAGFQIRDKMYHLQGAGFPKSLDVSKAIDAYLGKSAEREVVGPRITPDGKSYAERRPQVRESDGWDRPWKHDAEHWQRNNMQTAPATPEARQYAGWGTALKPSCEEWILCRKPLSEASVAKNVLVHGTGALNIDASRIPGIVPQVTQGISRRVSEGTAIYGNGYDLRKEPTLSQPHAQGRWPAQLLLSHTLLCTDDECDDGCPVKIMDAQSGMRKSGMMKAGTRRANTAGWSGPMPEQTLHDTYGDKGCASRYFAQFRPGDDYPPFIYAAKASRRERNAGCDALPERPGIKQFNEGMEGKERSNGTVIKEAPLYQNNHPTVKSQALMRYLVRLITPPGGVVLDFFAGSGSTGVAAIAEGFHYILIEQSAEYIEIIQARIAHAKGTMFEWKG